MSTDIDKEAVKSAYDDVRNDASDTNWAVFKFDGNSIILESIGTEYPHFQEKFGDDERVFGYVRITTGDEMSKRAKFALITWIGPEVGAMKRAKMSTDKTIVKGIVQNFAVEIQSSDREELDEEHIRIELKKSGGANYGTG